MIKILSFRVFFVFSFFYLLFQYLEFENLDYILKPLLIPLLSIGVFFSEKFATKKTLLTALLFSWIGDVFLLFSNKAEIYFIVGLISFLIAHLFYCFLFYKQINTFRKLNKTLFALGILLIAFYLAFMITVLLPTLGELKIPVIIYALVISSMFLFAYKGSLTWSKNGAGVVFFGAIFFVLSDSILAFNKFYIPIPKSTFFIMLTYLLAQYLITFGILRLNKTQQL